MEKVTAKAMKMFMKMDDNEVSEDEKEPEKELEHIDKKQKTVSDPVCYNVALSPTDAVKIALAAVDYHVRVKERWDFGFDAIEWAKGYAENVVEKSIQLKYIHGDSFNADEIAKAFDTNWMG